MSQLIPNEIPSGDINGTNTVFTFLNDIDYITTLVYDGAEYTNFVVDPVIRNQVTLVDAPISAIYADYYVLQSTVEVSTDCTFWDIKSEVWSLLGQRSTTGNFSDNVISRKINEVSSEVWKWKVVNKLNPRQMYRAGKMYFRDDFTNVRIKWGSTLTVPLNLWETEATMDPSNLYTSWYIELWWDIINYTGVSATQILWVSGQIVDHLVNEKAIQIYEMPLNMDKPWKVELIQKWDNINKLPIPQFDEQQNQTSYYQIIRTTDNKMLLKIVWPRSDDLVKVSYPRKYVKMNLNTDICPFPDDYGTSVIALLVAGVLWYNKGIPNSQQHLNDGYTALQTMYWDFNDEVLIIKQSISPKAYNFNSLRR